MVITIMVKVIPIFDTWLKAEGLVPGAGLKVARCLRPRSSSAVGSYFDYQQKEGLTAIKDGNDYDYNADALRSTKKTHESFNYVIDFGTIGGKQT